MLTVEQKFLTVQDLADVAIFGYLETALSFSYNADGVSYAVLYEVDDFDEDTTADCFVEVSDFLAFFRKITKGVVFDMKSVGGDFWLSRNNLGEGLASSLYGAYGEILDKYAKGYIPQYVGVINGSLRIYW